MAETRTPCRCTLMESGLEDMARLVQEYVESLSEDEKTTKEAYEMRLNACRACNDLRNGTCALCGCYVEARAAKRRQSCPAVPAKWSAEE